MGILSGNPKNEPMHYGEVYKTWLYLGASQALASGYQVLLNHAGDDDLKKFIKDKIENVIKPEIKQLQELLRENGVELPPESPARPEADLEQIPSGARFTDHEIAATLSADLAAGLISCSTIIGQCIREDIGMMFVKFHATKVEYGAKLLRMKKDKGWIIPPPLRIKSEHSE